MVFKCNAYICSIILEANEVEVVNFVYTGRLFKHILKQSSKFNCGKYKFWWPMMTKLKFYLRASSNSALETSSMPWFSVSSIDHLCRIDWFATSWACIGWRQLPPHLGIIDIYLCIYYVTSCVLPFLLFIDLSCVCNWSL